jgi:predicted glycogen debranching enzyme
MPTMRAIVDGYTAGTRYGIHVDPADSLVAAGADGYALTWMDARTNDHVVTPRIGKPVEVNALWVAGLATVARLGASTGADVADVTARHKAARASFRRRYPAGDGLRDVLDGPAGDDASLRPNQLLAWSLPDGPMDGPPPALDTLLTPLGVRSLDPADPAYLGQHRGDQTARDLAYHQGTVWPWLIGPYVAARHRADLPVDGLTAGLEAHLSEYGVGSISETADGDAPHGGTGCPFQAWSVAELLRARRLI